jgi:hypothetical protein
MPDEAFCPVGKYPDGTLYERDEQELIPIGSVGHLPLTAANLGKTRGVSLSGDMGLQLVEGPGPTLSHTTPRLDKGL